MTINKETIRSKLNNNGSRVEHVMDFNYLGVNINSSENLLKEMKTQAQKAAGVAGCLNDLVCRNKYTRKAIKIKHIQGNRTPNYDICTGDKGRNIKIQTGAGNKRDESTMEIVGKTKIDRIRSQRIRESSGNQPIKEWVER